MHTEELSRVEAPDPDPAARQDWWVDANCNTGTAGLTALFFSDELVDIAEAKRICATCPVLESCLAGAIERRERMGVWGGQLFRNGRVLASKRQRGRPPKVARASDRMPEVPVPPSLQREVSRRTQSVA